MLKQCKQCISLAGLTAVEIIRQPVCFLLVVSCMVIIPLLPVLVSHTLGESERMVRDSAFALQFVGGLLLGGLAASSTLAQDIRAGTAGSVLSTPVSRELFFFAKFLGVVAVLVLFEGLTSMATLMSSRMAAIPYRFDWWIGAPAMIAPIPALLLAAVINYIRRRPFCSSAVLMLVLCTTFVFVVGGCLDTQGRPVAFGTNYNWTLIPLCVLMTMAVTLLAAISVSLATRLDMVPTICLCSVIFFLGLISDYLFGQNAATHAVAGFFYTLLPNFQHFWIVDTLTAQGYIPWNYVARTSLYAAFYLCGILGLGLVAFRHMDIR